MEFLLGVLSGVVLAAIAGAVGVWWLVRDPGAVSRSEIAPTLPPALLGVPVVTVTLAESFLNHQLHTALAGNALGAAESSDGGLFQFQLEDAALDVRPGQRALFSARLSVAAWNFRLGIRPVSELAFTLREGRVRLVVERVQLARFNVPRALVERVVSQILTTAEAKLDQSLLPFERETGVKLTALESTDGTLILRFTEPEPGENGPSNASVKV